MSDEEYQLVLKECRQLSPARGDYRESDFIQNLFLTAIDFQMHGRAVEKAIEHYRKHNWSTVRNLKQLEDVLSGYPNDKDGNTSVAQLLWGNNMWTRVGLLRELTRYFESVGVEDQRALAKWARASDYDRDFKGRVKGLGYAIYNWLVMRQGVETVKPDVHLHRFVERILGRTIGDEELVRLLEQVASDMKLRAYELDWRIWEYQRGAGLELWKL